ncbi:MAG: ETX/MTX2 family pore-forming toxin [Isosphaeraceae bacterium]
MPITNLPTASTPPAALPSGTVKLFRDDNWSSPSYTIDIYDYTPSQRQSISGTPMQDAATWIAFNLPAGTVMTLTDNVASNGPGGCSDLKGAGRVVDLVGTGTTQSVDLRSVNMNDCISSFFWRPVNLGMGAIELYENANYSGNRTVLFLSEWPASTVTSLDGWYIDDKLSSARWDTLIDTESATLFDNVDGTGKSYGNIKGYGSIRAIANFQEVGFNDCASAFEWQGLAPVKEEIAPFTVNLSGASVGNNSFVEESSGTNDTSLPQTQTITLSEADAQTVTVTSSDTNTVGTTIGVSYTVSAGVEGVASASTTVSVQLSYTYSHTSTTERSATVTQSLSISQEFTAPPYTDYTGQLVAKIGTLPPTNYSTTAKRWYTQPLPGTTLDPSTGWYMRTETVTGTIQGQLCSQTQMNITTSPISAMAAAHA